MFHAYVFKEEIDSYLEEEALYRQAGGIDAYRKVLLRLSHFIGDEPITPRLALKYLISRSHLAPSTVSAEWSVLSSFSRWRFKDNGGESLVSLLRRPRVPQPDVIQASATTIKQVALWIEGDEGLGRSRRFCSLCLYAGLRFDEARNAD